MVQLGNVGDGPYRTPETKSELPTEIPAEVETWLKKSCLRNMLCHTKEIKVGAPNSGNNYKYVNGWYVTLGISEGGLSSLSASAEHEDLNSAILAAYNKFRNKVL